jgi:formylmethanofuran dehydrogenase subunit E
MDKLQQLLDASAAHHDHLCPRQVLGVKMGVYAAELLGVNYPQSDKRLFSFVETDGCFADGISAATGCTLGHRTLRLMDLGKVAAVFVDTKTHHALRLRPCLNIREVANQCGVNGRSRWHTQLVAYQQLAFEALFDVQQIHLNLAMEEIISRAGVRVNCARCGEEIINEREVYQDGQYLCQTCAGNSYYSLLVPTFAYMD